jgi:hypothetical protein
MMEANNPAAAPCSNLEKSPNGEHTWIRRADGTAECAACGVRLSAAQTLDAFAVEGGTVNRKAGKGPDKGAAT